MSKKKGSLSPIKKYNRLFKFLAFDLSLTECVVMTIIILVYLFAIFQLFSLLKVEEIIQSRFPPQPVK
ncbi:MAG: hypothetical protein I3273_00550 [Candidatus Moeniiplasma glomeromycotorum]|nr:hypothetical protein [Candidatus Moeniiplasma glomeromycotorum]MCE8167385.1 hypothetical protein [Candidatus Moeniiplasma glomeromycotorum]MCE8168602.1 hypothetical protein [Candidatus Moeniiplasma glomeromycotorum]